MQVLCLPHCIAFTKDILHKHIMCIFIIIMIDLQDLPQLLCFKCQNPTNQLADHQETSLSVCDRCLQSQTRKYIRLVMEIEAYQKKIKQIREGLAHQENSYRNSINSLETLEGEIGGEVGNEAGRQLLSVQQQLAREEAEGLRLWQQLKQTQSQEQVASQQYHKQWVALEQAQQKIGEQQQRLNRMRQFQQHVKRYGKTVEQIAK